MRSFLKCFQFHLHSDRRIFKTMLRKNLIIALTAVLISIPLVVYSCAAVINREMESIRSSAVYAIEEITGELSVIRNMAAAILEDDDITKLRQMPPVSSSSDYLTAGNARKFVGRITASNESIEEIFIYFDSSDCVLTSDCVFIPASQMSVIYDFDLADELLRGGWTSNAPHRLLPCGDLTRYSYSNSRQPVAGVLPVSFCYSIPATRPKSASIYVLLKSSYIAELFPGFIRDQGSIRLTNSAGDVLFEHSASERAPLLRWGLSHEGADSTGTLHLELFFPITGILELIHDILMLFILVTLAALIVPIILAYRMTQRQYAPVIEIMEKMDKYGLDFRHVQSKDAFVVECIDVLSNARSEALARLDSLNEMLQRNATLLLLNGATNLHPDWTKNFPEWYVVVYGCMDICDDRERLNDSLLSTVTLEHVVQQIHSGTTLHHLSPNSFAFIYPVDSGNADEPTKMLNRLVSLLDAQFGGSLRLSVSRLAHGAENVYLMLEQARTAMLRSNDASALITASESDNRPTMHFQNAVSFYQALMAGDYDQSVRIIRQMTTMDMLSHYGVRDLYEYLSDILCFAACDSGCREFDRPKPYGVGLMPSQLLDHLEQAAQQICDYRAVQKDQQASSQRRALIDYIHENLSKYDLSVKEIAEACRVSENAVQMAVYSESGGTFANYLRTERMNMAAQLLQTTDMQVGAICSAVGYNTISAFHKAFKRAYGVAPGEYRDQMIGKEMTDDAGQPVTAD